MDFFSGLSYGDQLEMGMASTGASMDPDTYNTMLRQQADEQALAKQVNKYGESHGRDAYAQAVAPGAAPPQESASTPATVQHAGVLLPNPEKVRRKDPKKEPTYRLRKAMGLV